MPPIPGKIDGEKVGDKRIYLLPEVIQNHYKQSGQWDRIKDVRMYASSGWESYTVTIGNYRHYWKYNKKWRKVKEKWIG